MRCLSRRCFRLLIALPKKSYAQRELRVAFEGDRLAAQRCRGGCELRRAREEYKWQNACAATTNKCCVAHWMCNSATGVTIRRLPGAQHKAGYVGWMWRRQLRTRKPVSAPVFSSRTTYSCIGSRRRWFCPLLFGDGFAHESGHPAPVHHVLLAKRRVHRLLFPQSTTKPLDLFGSAFRPIHLLVPARWFCEFDEEPTPRRADRRVQTQTIKPNGA